jgi:hypothetical protein
MLGDQLANRELGAIARQLESDRQYEDLIGTLRSGPEERLQSLVLHRECLCALLDQGCRSPQAAAERELAHLDAAIELLKSALARADFALSEAQRDRRERERELTALQSEADVNRLGRALAGPSGDLPPWRVRVCSASDLVRASHAEAESQQAQLALSALPD